MLSQLVRRPGRASLTADVLLAGVLAVVMFLAVRSAVRELSPAIWHYSTWDYWFESDPPAFFAQMAESGGRHHSRNSHHPLSSLVLFPVVHAMRAVLGGGVQDAIVLLLALVAAVWIALTYALLRLLTLRRGDALVFTALAASSASVVFWFAVPETLVFGALAILAAVMMVALSERGVAVPVWALVLVSAATLSFTSTDWLAGLLMLFLVLPRRRALLAGAASLGLVGLAWCLQKLLFPASGFPLSLGTDAETLYLFNKEALGFWRKNGAFLFHAILMPEIGDAYGFRLSVQAAAPGAGSALAVAGVAVWSSLLALAAWSVYRYHRSKTALMLVGVIAGQWLVAQVFGVETFFYSSHWGPLLVIFCALGALTPRRPIVVSLAAGLLVAASLGNVPKFVGAAARLHDRYQGQREFTDAVTAFTAPDALLLCGVQAAAAQGEPSWPAGRDPSAAEVGEIGSSEEPDTCYFQFDGQGQGRRGWMVSHEDWNIDSIEIFRQRGARYFVTSYQYGIDHAPALVTAMDARFRRMDGMPNGVLYELTPPREPSTSAPDGSARGERESARP